VRRACLKVDMPLGIFGVDSDAVKPYILKGFTMIALGTDTQMFVASARKKLNKVRE